jgi:hypothetical protein
MKTVRLLKNGVFVTEFEWNFDSKKSLKKKCLELSKTDINVDYCLTVEINGRHYRTFTNHEVFMK